MGKSRKNTQRKTPARNLGAGKWISADDTGTGLTTSVASDFDATDLNPQTCCSNCQTVFEVSLELLSSTDTRVRCGECLSIFDALANLRDMNAIDESEQMDDADISLRAGNASQGGGHVSATKSVDYRGTSNLADATAAGLAGLSNNTSSLDVTYSDFDLFSADAGLPEVAYFDQTRDAPGFDFEDVAEEERDETFSDTLFARDVTVDARSPMGSGTGTGLRASIASQPLHGVALERDVDYISDDAAHETLTFKYREQETLASPIVKENSPYDAPSDPKGFTGFERDVAAPIAPSSPWLLRSLLFVLFVTLAGGLYMYQQRNKLANSSTMRPVLELVCSILPCEVSAQTDLQSLRAVNRTVVSHPTLANALIIKFGIVNEAQFGQPYPVLEIRLTDRAGRLVVTNSFSPPDYTNNWQAGDVLDIGKRLDVTLTVEDPGNTATSFELDFRRSR